MSVLFEVLGSVFAEAFGPTGEDHTRGEGDVFLDGEWVEGELFFGPSKIIWDERIVFSPAEGRVETVTEDVEREIAPNYVILRFRRPDDVVLLAVHRRELKRVGAVLQLPT
jgi:hypothetical protein